MSPYTFEYNRYRHEFINRKPPLITEPSRLPRILWLLWTNEAPMTERRQESLKKIRELHRGMELILVTPENIHQYILDDHPLSPAYKYLSAVHRSDYLRAYLMHHYGGMYMDIKKPLESWIPAFLRLERSNDKWAIGYRELNAGSGARLPRKIGADLRRHHAKLIGMGGFIMRSHTPLTAEWLREVENRLKWYEDSLRESPGDAYGTNLDYPIGWTNLLGKILGPVLLKYHDRLIIDQRLLLAFKDYR